MSKDALFYIVIVTGLLTSGMLHMSNEMRKDIEKENKTLQAEIKAADERTECVIAELKIVQADLWALESEGK